MKPIATFAALALLIGCGEGPKHLPKADYLHGKAAFEMLEQYEQASAGPPPNVERSGPFLLSAAEQEGTIPKGDLMDALGNYQGAIEERVSVEDALALDRVEEETAELKPNNDAAVKALSEKMYAARRAAYDIQPILKLCHDDAAQYFDASATSTGDCKSQLAAFRAKYPESTIRDSSI